MTRYATGANFERLVRRQLESQGCFAVRSAGSHGPVDVLAITPDGEPLFIQCKLKGAITKSDKSSLVELANKYHAKAYLAQKAKGGPALTELN